MFVMPMVSVYYRSNFKMNTCKNVILISILFSLVISFFSCKKEDERIMRVRNDSISDISYITAKAIATIIDPGVGIVQHGHCWSANAEPTINENENMTDNGQINNTGPYSSILTSLTPGTKYYVRAYVKNGETVVYGYDILPFTTLPMNKPVVISGTVSSITTSGATVSGNLNDLGAGASSVTQYGHCWSSEITTPVLEDNENKTSLGSRSTTGSFESVLIGLSPGSLNYVRSYATNEAGTSYGDVLSFTTLEQITAEFDASPKTGYLPLSVQFTDMSTGDINTWSWNFGDDETSSSQNPLHTYAAQGSYSVTLTVGNSDGSDSETKNNYIIVSASGTAPVAGFTANQTSIVEGENVSFTDQSVNTPVSWSWAFGDGGISTSQNPTHQYNNAGTYSVTLTATNSFGSDTETKNNYITVSASGSAPVTGFTADKTSITEGQTVNFTDQSLNGPTSWSWIFGDGGTSSSQNPSYQYNTEGTYNVTLTATNSFGEDTETKNNYITVESEQPETVTDIDGNEYNTVQIGDQVWMSENLSTTRYSDGNALVDGTGADDITDDYTTKYYFAYADNQSNVVTYGRLYTWAAVMNGATTSNSNPSGVQGVCPTGWHVPGDSEWKQLEMHLDMTQSEADDTDWRGTNEGSELKEKGTTHWTSPNTGASNESGFTALPGGLRLSDGTFGSIGDGATFWLSTQYNSSWAWYRTLWYGNEDIHRNYWGKDSGRSVRCVKD